jgi:hypothetical protein
VAGSVQNFKLVISDMSGLSMDIKDDIEISAAKYKQMLETGTTSYGNYTLILDASKIKMDKQNNIVNADSKGNIKVSGYDTKNANVTYTGLGAFATGTGYDPS